MKIVEIPAEVEEVFAPFRGVLSRPQYRHFLCLVLGLILPSSKKKTVQSIAESYASGRDRSCLSRFLERSPWEVEKAVNQALELLYRQLPKQRWGLSCLILDDSSNEKFGRKIEGAGWLHDPMNLKRHIFGHNYVMSLAQVGGVCFPVGVRLYLKHEFCMSRGMGFRTKNELAAELITSYAPRFGKQVVVVFDGWYLNEQVIEAVANRGWRWVSRLKSNRRIEVAGQSWMVRDLIATLGEADLQETGFVPRSHELPIIGCIRRGSLRKLGEVVMVFGCNENGEWQSFASNLLSWPLERLMRVYDRRWEIECCFRESKQHLGLGESQARLLRCAVIHLHMVMIAWILLAALKLKHGLPQATIGDLCRWVGRQVERSQIAFIQGQGKSRAEREKLEALLLAA
jgi:hypothetical protein